MIDLRRIRIGIEVSGAINWYEGLRVKAKGSKHADPTQNECTVTISGLSQPVRDSLISATKTATRRLIVEAGRVSTGAAVIFVGDIYEGEPSSPPDVDVVLKAKTGNGEANRVSVQQGVAVQPLSSIANRVAADLGVGLDFQATNKNMANYTYVGSAIKQVLRLQDAGGVQAFIDDRTLVVKDLGRPVAGRTRIVSMETGMVGIPKRTDEGVEVTYLIDGPSDLGGTIDLRSVFNPTLNGLYAINQLNFDIASHEDPFFYTAVCNRL
jgi:hypothetical protein